jgi:glycosyltransferase involved in cell wall biosynthesis
MKLMWHSNAPWVATGYGQQTALFAPRLAQHYDLQISAFYGLQGAPLEWNGVRVLAGNGDTYGNDEVPFHVERFFGEPRGGIVFTLMDVWVLNPDVFSQLNTVCWTPVDHAPAPPGVRGFLERSNAIPIAMSKFGAEQLADFDPLYVPHAVDTSVYKPVDKLESRKMIGMDPDMFVVGMVAANKGNPSRKGFAQALEAFGAFHKKHENAFLYLYTDLTGATTRGVHLPSLFKEFEIPPHAVAWPAPYEIHFNPLTPSVMASVYSSMDVLLNPALGEGFGVPVLEAQACGVPAIVTGFSAMPEVCGAGWHVKGTRTWTPQRSWQMTADVEDIYNSLEACYRLPTRQRELLGEKARAHALEYDVERVMSEHMLPALEEAQERLGERTAIPEVHLRKAA